MFFKQVNYLQNVQLPGEWLTEAYQIPEIIRIFLVPGISREKKFKSLWKGPLVVLDYSELRNLKFSLGLPCGSDSKESACNAGDRGSIPGLARSSGGGNSNPLQCSCLENLMDRGDWRATIHGVAQSQTLSEWVTFSLSRDLQAHCKPEKHLFTVRAPSRGISETEVRMSHSHSVASPCSRAPITPAAPRPLTQASLRAPETAEAAPLTVPTALRSSQDSTPETQSVRTSRAPTEAHTTPARRHRAHLNHAQSPDVRSTSVQAASALFPQGQGEAVSFLPIYFNKHILEREK